MTCFTTSQASLGHFTGRFFTSFRYPRFTSITATAQLSRQLQVNVGFFGL